MVPRANCLKSAQFLRQPVQDTETHCCKLVLAQQMCRNRSAVWETKGPTPYHVRAEFVAARPGGGLSMHLRMGSGALFPSLAWPDEPFVCLGWGGVIR